MFIILLVLAVNVSRIWATDYEIILEDLFLPCTDGPPGSIFLNESFNMDNLEVFEDPDGIHFSGNTTTLWSYPRTDRISLRFNLMHFNRGFWEPTVFNLQTRNICDSMFDKNSFWYQYWFKHLVNPEEVKETCLATKDAVLRYHEFVVDPRLRNVIGDPLRGRYKSVMLIEVFDKNNVRRETSTCFELRGEVQKIK